MVIARALASDTQGQATVLARLRYMRKHGVICHEPKGGVKVCRLAEGARPEPIESASKHPKWAAIRDALKDKGPEAERLAAQLVDEPNRDVQQRLRFEVAHATMMHHRAELEAAGLRIGHAVAAVIARWIGEGTPTFKDLDAWIEVARKGEPGDEDILTFLRRVRTAATTEAVGIGVRGRLEDVRARLEGLADAGQARQVGSDGWEIIEQEGATPAPAKPRASQQGHRELAALPDGHDVRVGAGTVEVKDGDRWVPVADTAEACEALAHDLHEAVELAASAAELRFELNSDEIARRYQRGALGETRRPTRLASTTSTPTRSRVGTNAARSRRSFSTGRSANCRMATTSISRPAA